MSLVRFTQSPITSFLDDIFSNQWAGASTLPATSLPAVNVQEQEKEFVLSLAVPGMNKNDFTIDVDQDVLSISAVSKENPSTTDNHFTRREFNFHSFKRSFSLPESVDTTKIKAKYIDGILTVHLTKRKEALPQPTKRIAIE